jgi:hypothetical protein
MLSINPSSMSIGKRVFSMYWPGHATILNPPFSVWSRLNGLLMSSSRNSRVSIPIFLITYLYFSHARGMNISLNLCISVDHLSLVDGCEVLPKLSTLSALYTIYFFHLFLILLIGQWLLFQSMLWVPLHDHYFPMELQHFQSELSLLSSF